MDKFEMYLCFFILPIFFFLLYLYTKRLISSLNNTDKNPPSPPRLPILGHLHHLSYLPHRSLWDLSKKYGPLMLLQLGPMPMLVVSSADVAKEVLKTHDVSFADRPNLSTIKRFFYNPKDVIVSPYGEQWRKLKSILVHRLLHNRKIKSFNSIMEEETSLLLEKISKLNSSSSGGALNLTTMFMSLTNDIISRSAFGKKLSPKQGKKLLDAIKEGLGLAISYNLGEFVPWLSWINRLNGFDAAVERVLKMRDEILDGVIRENLDDEERGGESLIDTLLDIHMDGNHHENIGESSTIDIESVKALLLDVVVAGTDTTAIVLEWAMTELIRNPIVMSKVEAEVQEIMGDKDMMISEKELEKMHYLRAVIKETLRYHPPLTISYRMSREEVVDMMGYNIPAKTGVIINVWAIGRDPAYWDHDPEKFWPDRFMINNSPSTTPDFKGFDFHFTPFGAGRRICPGISFAVGVAELVLANLVHRFNWALPNGAKGEDLDVTEKPGPTNGRKNPLILIATNKP